MSLSGQCERLDTVAIKLYEYLTGQVALNGQNCTTTHRQGYFIIRETGPRPFILGENNAKIAMLGNQNQNPQVKANFVRNCTI